MTASAIAKSNGFTKETMIVTLSVNVIHIVGNYLFIYGELGFPQWGITGVAISTACSRLIGLIVLSVLNPFFKLALHPLGNIWLMTRAN